jgi:cobalt-zinc-cadmium efflux system membrane fusion protein
VANVFETDISKIKVGSPVKVTTISYPDKVFDGKVERISSMLNTESNAISVKINLENKDYLLKPGMFANISVFFPEGKKMLVVPAKSILYDDNKQYVVLFNKRCDVSMQEVSVYKSLEAKCFIESDILQPGNTVIDQNNLFVFTALKKL